jgi:hypothetical protein
MRLQISESLRLGLGLAGYSDDGAWWELSEGKHESGLGMGTEGKTFVKRAGDKCGQYYVLQSNASYGRHPPQPVWVEFRCQQGSVVPSLANARKRKTVRWCASIIYLVTA